MWKLILLITLAFNKGVELQDTDYWSHSNQDGCDYRCRVLEVFEKEDYKWIGENLYVGSCDIDNAYKLWAESPAHQEILVHDYDYSIIVVIPKNKYTCYIILERLENDI